jgi:hypothetical protein
MNKRSCHVLSCKENESLDVITTIGQAFELRYNEYMQTQQIGEQQGYDKFLFVIFRFNFYVSSSFKSLERDEHFQQVRVFFIGRLIE